MEVLLHPIALGHLLVEAVLIEAPDVAVAVVGDVVGAEVLLQVGGGLGSGVAVIAVSRLVGS